MNEGALAARFTEALIAAAQEESGGQSALVSMAMEVIDTREPARVETGVQRKTRTLLFMHADAFAQNGARIATASSVHKIKG